MNRNQKSRASISKAKAGLVARGLAQRHSNSVFRRVVVRVFSDALNIFLKRGLLHPAFPIAAQLGDLWRDQRAVCLRELIKLAGGFRAFKVLLGERCEVI